MPKGYPSLSQEQKQTIAARIKEKGEPVADLAKEYRVSPRIIYHFLSRSGQHSGSLLELAKVKREKQGKERKTSSFINNRTIGR